MSFLLANTHDPLIRDLFSRLRNGVASAAELCRELGISQAKFSRLVSRAADDLLVIGKARNTRYALRRDVASLGRSIPVYAINDKGKTRSLGLLEAIQPEGYYFSRPHDSRIFDGLPYFIDDLRPAGFLGRLVPRQHPELNCPADIRNWSADHILQYLAHYGWNLLGNLIIGEEAFRLYLKQLQNPEKSVAVKDRPRIYCELARNALELGDAGSSAGGEQPKFLARRGKEETPVIVKFSPATSSHIAKRRADLLLAEHLVHLVLRKHKISAVKSEIIAADNQVFLEVERFDRLANDGRKGFLSLQAFDSEFVGSGRSWSETAKRLHRDGHLNANLERQIIWLETFGKLIGNSDMHLHNLSFFVDDLKITALTPTYDMLPMMYAPQNEQLVERHFEAPVPKPEDASLWHDTCLAAQEFWTSVTADERISPDFKKIAKAHQGKLLELESLTRRVFDTKR